MFRFLSILHGWIVIAAAFPVAESFSTTPLWQRPALHGHKKDSHVLLVSISSDVNDMETENSTMEEETSTSKEWVGGFIQDHPKLDYPQALPDLSSLGPLQGNHDNIDKLDRMQKVRWPEFTWLRDKGDPSTRLYLRFYDDISRIGYTKEGRLYSIICPQMGFDLTELGFPGTANIEVHVGHCRGWVDETTHTICGDMTIFGKIWIDMTDEERKENPVIASMEKALATEGRQFPFTKEDALTLLTHVPNKPYTNIIPLLNGTYTDFATPEFASHWKRKYHEKGRKAELYSVANVVCQVADVPKTGSKVVDDFNDILMTLQSMALGGILDPGSIITWNVWFTGPEVVDQAEWQSHHERFQKSVDTHNSSYTLHPSTMQDFNGNHIYKQVAIKELTQLGDLWRKIHKFHQDAAVMQPEALKYIRQIRRKFLLKILTKAVLPTFKRMLRKYLLKPVLAVARYPFSAIDRLLGKIFGFLIVGRNDPIPGVHPPPTGAMNSLFRYLNMESHTIPLLGKYYLFNPRQILGIKWKPRSRLIPTDFRRTDIIGKNKTDDSLEYFKNRIGRITKMKEANERDFNLPENYNYFPDPENAEEELVTILKTNPLFASALTKEANGSGFEVKSYDPNYDAEVDDSSYPWFLRLVSTLPKHNAGRRINIKFDPSLTKITSFEEFEDDGSFKTYNAQHPQYKELLDDAIGKTQLNLVFYASSVHVMIHVLHTLMVQSFNLSSRGHDDMHTWSKWYNKNMMILYRLQNLIINSILSGGSGYRADHDRIPPMLEELLNLWGKSPNDFIKNMFSLTPDEMKDAGIMTEFFSQYENVDGYVSEVCDALKHSDTINYDRVVEETTDKLKVQCGKFQSNINSFEDWLYLMTVTGMFQGGTHTAARFFLAPHIMKWISPDSEQWTKDDANIIGSYGVNGDNNKEHCYVSEANHKFSRAFLFVLQKYQCMSDDLKEKYIEHAEPYEGSKV